MSHPVNSARVSNVWQARAASSLSKPSQSHPEPNLIESDTPRGRLFNTLRDLKLIDGNGVITQSGPIYLNIEQQGRLFELYNRPFKFASKYYTFEDPQTWVSIQSLSIYLYEIGVSISDIKLVGRGIYYVLGPDFLFNFLKEKLGSRYPLVVDKELSAYIQEIAQREPSDIDVRFIIAAPQEGEKVYSLEYYLVCLEEHMASKISPKEKEAAIKCLQSNHPSRTRQGPIAFSESFLNKRKIVKEAKGLQYVIVSVGEKNCPLEFMLWRENTVPIAPTSTKSLELSFLTGRAKGNGWKLDQILFDKLLKINRFRYSLDSSFWGSYIESLCEGAVCSEPDTERKLHVLMQNSASNTQPLSLIYAREASRYLESHAQDQPLLAKVYLLNALCFLHRRSVSDAEMRQFLSSISYKTEALHPLLDALLSSSQPVTQSLSLLAKLCALALYTKRSFAEFSITGDEQNPQESALICFSGDKRAYRLRVPFSWARLEKNPQEDDMGGLKPVLEAFSLLETPDFKEGGFFKQEELTRFHLSLFGVASGDYPSFFQQLQRLMEKVSEKKTGSEAICNFLERARPMLAPDLILAADDQQIHAVEWFLVKLSELGEYQLLDSLLMSFAKRSLYFLVKTRRYVPLESQQQLVQRIFSKIALDCNWSLFISTCKKIQEKDSPVIAEGFRLLVETTLSRQQLEEIPIEQLLPLLLQHHSILDETSFKTLYLVVTRHYLKNPPDAPKGEIFSLYQCAVNRLGIQPDLLQPLASLLTSETSPGTINTSLLLELAKGRKAETLSYRDVSPFIISSWKATRAEKIKGLSAEEYSAVFWVAVQKMLNSNIKAKDLEIVIPLLGRAQSLEYEKMPCQLSSEDYEKFLAFLRRQAVEKQNFMLLELLLSKLPKAYPYAQSLLEAFLEKWGESLNHNPNPRNEELVRIINWVMERSSQMTTHCLEKTYFLIMQGCLRGEKPNEALIRNFYCHVREILGIQPAHFAPLLELLLEMAKTEPLTEESRQFLLKEGAGKVVEPEDKLAYLVSLSLSEKELRTVGTLYSLEAINWGGDLTSRASLPILKGILQKKLALSLECKQQAFQDLLAWIGFAQNDEERLFVHSLLFHSLAKSLPSSQSISKKSCITYQWIQERVLSCVALPTPDTYEAHYIDFERNLLYFSLKEILDEREGNFALFFDIYNLIKHLSHRSTAFKVAMEIVINQHTNPVTQENFSYDLTSYPPHEVSNGRALLASITWKYHTEKGFILTWHAELKDRELDAAQMRALLTKFQENLNHFPTHHRLEAITFLYINCRATEEELRGQYTELKQVLIDVQVPLFALLAKTVPELQFQKGVPVYQKAIQLIEAFLSYDVILDYYTSPEKLETYVKLLREMLTPMNEHLRAYTLSSDHLEEERDLLLKFSMFFTIQVFDHPFPTHLDPPKKGKKEGKRPTKSSADPVLELTFLYIDWLQGLYREGFYFIYGMCLTAANASSVRKLEDYITSLHEKKNLSNSQVRPLVESTKNWKKNCHSLINRAKDRLPTEMVHIPY